MWGLGPATKVDVAVGATDLRKGFEGLYGLARDALGLEPLSGQLVLFCNRDRTRLKVLFSRWQWALALHKTVRKRQVQLATSAAGGRGLRHAQCGGVRAVSRRHRLEPNPPQKLVSKGGLTERKKSRKKAVRNPSFLLAMKGS